jgi:hypothetical protein
VRFRAFDVLMQDQNHQTSPVTRVLKLLKFRLYIWDQHTKIKFLCLLMHHHVGCIGVVGGAQSQMGGDIVSMCCHSASFFDACRRKRATLMTPTSAMSLPMMSRPAPSVGEGELD